MCSGHNPSVDMKTAIIRHIHTVLSSNEFAKRINLIHRHYPNLKSEGRYRDALLEVFNESEFALKNGWVAFAEARKVDLVVTQRTNQVEDWVRIEMKYHFTHDMIYRVRNTLKRIRDSSLALDEFVSQKSKKGDLINIARDCISHKGKKEPSQCDLFILIVQNRWGTTRHLTDPQELSSKKQRTCPRVFYRGVEIQFLNEQLTDMYVYGGDTDAYNKAWTEATYLLLEAIHEHRKFKFLEPVKHVMLETQMNIPLSSYFFGLDFLNPAPEFQKYSKDIYSIS